MKELISKLVVAHLNISSIRNKFEVLVQNVSGEVGRLTDDFRNKN